MADIQLFDREITDKHTRENFVRIRQYVKGDSWGKGRFIFFEKDLAAKTYPAAVSFLHGLNFQPKDVIPLAITPDTATATWKYDSFSRDSVYLTISAACTIRAFIGRYEET